MSIKPKTCGVCLFTCENSNFIWTFLSFIPPFIPPIQTVLSQHFVVILASQVWYTVEGKHTDWEVRSIDETFEVKPAQKVLKPAEAPPQLTVTSFNNLHLPRQSCSPHVCGCECVCSGPLAGAVSGLLDGVADPSGVATAVELHWAPLQPCLPAAFTEASVCVDVVVVDAGGGTLPITWHDVHLQNRNNKWSGCTSFCSSVILRHILQIVNSSSGLCQDCKQKKLSSIEVMKWINQTPFILCKLQTEQVKFNKYIIGKNLKPPVKSYIIWNSDNTSETYRSVAATVVLPDCHPHCHFLTRLSIFFACSYDNRTK